MPSETHPDFNPILSARLLAAANEQDHATFQALLLRSDVDINIVGPDSLNAFMISVVNGDHAGVTALAARGDLLINAKAEGGFSALMLASALNEPDMVQTMLMREDLQINDANDIGNTALMLGATRGHAQVVKLFKSREDVDVNAANKHGGGTALILASIAGQPDTVECLNKFPGINLDAVDDMHCTALMHAVVHKHLPIVDSLKNCANINATNNLKWTALMYAADTGDQPILLSLLKVARLDVNAVSEDEGKSALMIAAQKGHDLLVKDLMDFGADIRLLAADGRTAQEMARDACHTGLADLLAAAQAHLAEHGDDAALSVAWTTLPATPSDEDDYLEVHQFISLDASNDDRLLESAFAEQEEASPTDGSVESLNSDFTSLFLK